MDPKTIFIILILTLIISNLALFVLWRENRKRCAVLNLWLADLFNRVPYGIVLSRLTNQTIINVNARTEKLLGYKTNELIGKTTEDLNMWISVADHNSILNQLKLGMEIDANELELRRKDNTVITVMYSASVINLYGETCILSCLNDVSAISHMKKKLHKMATHDQLTGLPNRMLLYDRYEMTLAHAARSNKKMVVAMIDLDCFKDINDAFGHDMGDKLLVQVGRRILRYSRKEDTAARFGGDEFIIFMSDVENREIADAALRRMLRAFMVPFVINGEALKITLSIGVALYPDNGSEINDLVRKADLSMYQVKKNGKNNLLFYEE
jgi:diguanylate cyclase (GGDEF)-like protein/PAS domain S-box-containing protein